MAGDALDQVLKECEEERKAKDYALELAENFKVERNQALAENATLQEQCDALLRAADK